jgi:NADH-quinone oxidoreductase subunit J
MVYVGAIAVLFLFVIMMLNIRIMDFYYVSWKSYLFLILFGFFFFIIILFYFIYIFFNLFNVSNLIFNLWVILFDIKTNIYIIGSLLYNTFFYIFFLSSFILLVAMIGSIVLTNNNNNNEFKKYIYLNRNVYFYLNYDVNYLDFVYNYHTHL